MVKMTPLHSRYLRSLAALNDLPVGASAWFWVTTPCADGLPFFALVSQKSDPDGAKLVRRAQWLADQRAPVFSARGVVRRLQSGMLTLSTDAPLAPVGAVYAALCQRAPMPDILVIQLEDGSVSATRLLQDLQPLSDALGAMDAGEMRWFSISDTAQPDRLQLAAQREALGDVALVGQLRCCGGGDYLMRVEAAKAQDLGAALQQWGPLATAWPTLQALSCARIVTRKPRARKST